MEECKVFIQNKEQAEQIYDFIREHLEVVNNVPYVEALMLALEEYLEG